MRKKVQLCGNFKKEVQKGRYLRRGRVMESPVTRVADEMPKVCASALQRICQFALCILLSFNVVLRQKVKCL